MNASAACWRLRPPVRWAAEASPWIVELIGATATRTGLRVQAELDRGVYPLGVKVSDAALAAVPLTQHDWHGEWNYRVAGINRRGEGNERVPH